MQEFRRQIKEKGLNDLEVLVAFSGEVKDNDDVFTEEGMNKDKEGDRLLARCPKDGYVIALAIDGKQYDSVALSKHLEKLTVAGRSHLVFVIGGSLGLSKKVLARADEIGRASCRERV